MLLCRKLWNVRFATHNGTGQIEADVSDNNLYLDKGNVPVVNGGVCAWCIGVIVIVIACQRMDDQIGRLSNLGGTSSMIHSKKCLQSG